MSTLKKILIINILFATWLLTGCTTTQEKETFNNSLGILYPVAKLGQGISFLGSGIKSLGQPGSWSVARPEEYVGGVVSSEQDEYLESVSVKFDFDIPQEYRGYLSAGSSSFGPPIRSMFQRVEGTVGKRFDWRISPMLQDVAAAFPGSVIVVNPNVMGRLSLPGQYVFLFHEAGHHELGHTSRIGGMVQMGQPWMTKSLEQAADAYAGKSMKWSRFSANEIKYGAMDAFKGVPLQGTKTHPGRNVRINTVIQAATNP